MITDQWLVFLSNARKWQIQWNLSWETIFMRDHLSWQATHFRQDLHFNNFNITEKPVTRDHLSWQTTFLWPMGWSFKTGSTVLPSKLCDMMLYSLQDKHCDMDLYIAHIASGQIEMYTCHGLMVRKFRDEDFLGSVCSLNAFHPTQSILVGGNSSGRVHVFMWTWDALWLLGCTSDLYIYLLEKGRCCL